MAALRDTRIRHPVFLRLIHPAGSEAEAAFLAAIAALRTIEGVEEFESMRDVSPKNGYRFGLTMQFADHTAGEAYTAHPDHAGFVRARWASEVEDSSRSTPWHSDPRPSGRSSLA